MIFLKKIYAELQTMLSRFVNRGYEAYMRKRLKNKDFTILCSNCIGGIIYHRLGLPFRSPTINLWMHQRDYMIFAENIHEYQHLQLEFIETDVGYPVAKLGEITIYFNHSKTCEEASADWYRRMKRINFSNLFLIMYDREDIIRDDIVQFGNIPCRGRLVLSHRQHPDIPYVKTIAPTKRLFGAQCIDKDWLGLRTFEKHFDFVKWLNQKS